MKFDYRKIIDEVLSKNFWSRTIIMIISIFVLAVNYNIFLLHNELVVGGTSGLATIVNHFNNKIDPATFIFIFNVIFIMISFVLLGSKRTGLTIIGSLLYPLFVSITSGPCELLATHLEFSEFILIAIISGLLFGTANGFIYKTGFSTGGADILIQICNKYLKIPTGVASLVVNVIIIATGGFVFGIEKAIYAIIVVIINSFLVDKIMLGISDSKMFYIQTKKTTEVIEFINSIQSGYTIMRTDGGYSKKTNDIIMCVIPTRDYYMFNNVIKKIDPKAFLIISDCYQVYGGHRKEKFPFI